MGGRYSVHRDPFGSSARDGVTRHLECGVPYSLSIGLTALSVTNRTSALEGKAEGKAIDVTDFDAM